MKFESTVKNKNEGCIYENGGVNSKTYIFLSIISPG